METAMIMTNGGVAGGPIRAILAGLALFAIAGAALAEAGVIRGAASYAGPLDLRPGTVLEVELLDVSKADAPAERRGSVSVPVRRLGPIPFVVSYDPAVVEAANRYSVAARLVQDGPVILRTDSANLVLTGGAGNTVDLTLVPPGRPEAAVAQSGQAALAGTWTLEDVGGARAAAGVESYVSLTAEGEVLGRGGCNGFRGRYKVDGGALTLGPLAATRRACPPPQMQQETRFLAALEATRGFRIEDGRLVLVDALGDPVARLVRGE
jgi:putative lipoprotein